ncbi:MAG TPA: 7,8-didemethyl-8-hydroxy-5-deazariboflavin synthase CofG [Candidatus Acidoferrales bacterium]|jgi:FO synthase|nr:7,8-didemethyl-8-hydroxy-5-deazariboflavin synthase CofG [Candidatus Acidoferrales bacterium]
MPPLAIADHVDAALQAGLEGRGVSREEALWLLNDAPLGALLEAAGAVRDRYKGTSVSYSRKVFIPLTHLCRDYCGYCTFRADPQAGVQPYMTPDEVLAVAEAGRRAGCKEALFSLGDQPERVFPEAKEFLKKLGFERTLEYLAAMCDLVLEKTGLLPHSNPGVMAFDDLRRLRESNVSAGLMLESVSPRLLRPGGAHWKAPDKVPAVRLRTIENAGRLSMAFTTGILIGIGEMPEERVDSLLAIRAAHEKYRHIQEVIIQPFRVKPDIRMSQAAEPSNEDLLRTIAVARLIFGGDMNLQSPPNLLSQHYPDLLKGGINDWGGISPVTKDFINPEAAWPQISSLAARSASAGFLLRERLAIYPEFLSRPEFVNDRLEPHVRKLRGDDGYARGGAQC